MNYALRQIFEEKIYKVSLDGGFTCPNRDGKISTEGCIFCNESGSGDFAANRNKSIKEQIDEQLELLNNKFPKGKVIAYFQNFTNTYESVEYLRKIYYEALSHERVVGIAIATRPDCLGKEILELLDEINKKNFLWIELGLQTINENSAIFLNRGYNLKCFENGLNSLNKLEIKVVVHLILGIVGETKDDMLASVKYLSEKNIWGIKIHLLHIIKNTRLHKIYNAEKFDLFEKNGYIELVVQIISLLDPKIVIHRLTGDGNRDTLVEPKWSLNKKEVLNGINKLLKMKNLYQGVMLKKPLE